MKLQMLRSAVIFILCSTCFVMGQFPFIGKCPSPNVQVDFDVERFKGKWYEIERTMSFLEIGSECATTNFSDARYDDDSIEVLYEGRGSVLKLRLIAKVPDSTEPAKMKLRLTDLNLKTHYWVLFTDYDNYAVIWACNHIWATFQYARTENMWILARERTLSEKKLEKIHKKMDLFKDIKAKKYLKKVNQKKCEE